jgi:transposase
VKGDNFIMAGSKTGTRAKPVSKSEKCRDLIRGGMTIAEAAKAAGMGYAFAYGVAQRAGLAQTAAKRRPEANSKMIDLVLTVQPRWTRAKATAAVKSFLDSRKA